MAKASGRSMIDGHEEDVYLHLHTYVRTTNTVAAHKVEVRISDLNLVLDEKVWPEPGVGINQAIVWH